MTNEEYKEYLDAYAKSGGDFEEINFYIQEFELE